MLQYSKNGEIIQQTLDYVYVIHKTSNCTLNGCTRIKHDIAESMNSDILDIVIFSNLQRYEYVKNKCMNF